MRGALGDGDEAGAGAGAGDEAGGRREEDDEGRWRLRRAALAAAAAMAVGEPAAVRAARASRRADLGVDDDIEDVGEEELRSGRAMPSAWRSKSAKLNRHRGLVCAELSKTRLLRAS